MFLFIISRNFSKNSLVSSRLVINLQSLKWLHKYAKNTETNICGSKHGYIYNHDNIQQKARLIRIVVDWEQSGVYA